MSRMTRKSLKFLHTMGSIGYLGAILALAVLHGLLPPPTELQEFASLRIAMGAIAEWILLPSIGIVLVSGLFAIAASRSYQSAGWVWVKLATGILVFEGTLVYVQAPMERAALQARAALEGQVSVAELAAPLSAEWGSFWVLGAVAVLNVVLGVWRPRFRKSS